MHARLQGYLYLALAMLLVGSTVIASKIAAAGLPPFTATALRFAIAFPCFLGLLWLHGMRLPALSGRDWALLTVQAIAGSVGYTTLLIAGLRSASAADAAVILGTLPVVSAAIAVLVLGERPHRMLLLTILAAGAGVLAIAWQPGADAGGSLMGNALILGAVFCEGLFILLNKRLRTEIPPLMLSALMTGIGLAASLAPALLEAPWTGSAGAPAIWAVAYYALVPTVGGFLLWYAGAARVSGAEASVFTALAPMSALLLAALMLGEPVGWRQLAGMACVLAAVLALALPPAAAGRRARGPQRGPGRAAARQPE
ncbi:MAG TPA: DMT family transporter [Noviherbaspirillum sp.]|jgi:drug/metabolite transporter (DMT)-like permease|uniref:DMT family transporter n=1 Tax=Noviherbaspirillum sp. TaxID=1926288 RepID=UPI002F936EC3